MGTPELITPESLREWRLPDPAGSKKARGKVVIIGNDLFNSRPRVGNVFGYFNARVRCEFGYVATNCGTNFGFVFHDEDG